MIADNIKHALRAPLKAELTGYAAEAALTELQANWETAINDGESPNIILSDLEETIGILEEMLEGARKIINPRGRSKRELAGIASDVLALNRPDGIIPAELTKREVALGLCEKGHANKTRKFRDEAYANHPKRVGATVRAAYEAEGLPELGAQAELAAICHDLLSETTIGVKTIEGALGNDVADMVVDLSDHYTHDLYPTRSRASRKTSEFERLEACDAVIHSITLADIIDNLENFEEALGKDGEWAGLYLAEKEALVALLSKGLLRLQQQAKEEIAKARILCPTKAGGR